MNKTSKKRSLVISYPDFVDTDNIKCTDDGEKKYRYSLEIPFTNTSGKKTLCVILKNPSKATKIECDQTISKVCHVAYNHGYVKVVILNLFPYYSTDVAGLKIFFQNQDYDKKMERNQNEIKKQCENNETVFAWGKLWKINTKDNSRKYDAVIQSTINLVKGNHFFVDRCDCQNNTCHFYPTNQNVKHSSIRYPLHGLRWSHTSKIIPY